MVFGADARADAGADAGVGVPSPRSVLAQPGSKQTTKAVPPGVCKPIYGNALVQDIHMGVGKETSQQQWDPACPASPHPIWAHPEDCRPHRMQQEMQCHVN